MMVEGSVPLFYHDRTKKKEAIYIIENERILLEELIKFKGFERKSEEASMMLTLHTMFSWSVEHGHTLLCQVLPKDDDLFLHFYFLLGNKRIIIDGGDSFIGIEISKDINQEDFYNNVKDALTVFFFKIQEIDKTWNHIIHDDSDDDFGGGDDNIFF